MEYKSELMTKTTRTIIDYMYIVIGSAIAALAIVLFLNPAKLAPGGVSGIATIMFYLAGWDLGLTIFILTMPLFFIGLKLFGKQYGVKTLLGSLLLSVFTSIWTAVFGETGILDYSHEISTWLSTLYGGVLSGVGIGLVMKSGSNTGGTDIIAQIIARYTSLSLGTALFIIDGIIIAAAAIFLGLESALYAIVVAYITTVVINKIVLSMGTNYAKTVFIISEKTNEIGEYISLVMERGATILDAKGFYTKESRPMIMTVIPNQDVSRLTKAVNRIDGKAFMIINETFHVLGEGYTSIEKIAHTSDVTQH